jgi:hypothetical protein
MSKRELLIVPVTALARRGLTTHAQPIGAAAGDANP